jgi:hypothetical protein
VSVQKPRPYAAHTRVPGVEYANRGVDQSALLCQDTYRKIGELDSHRHYSDVCSTKDSVPIPCIQLEFSLDYRRHSYSKMKTAPPISWTTNNDFNCRSARSRSLDAVYSKSSSYKSKSIQYYEPDTGAIPTDCGDIRSGYWRYSFKNYKEI